MDWNVERIITRDKSSGTYHLRLKVNGRLYTNEQCNLDQAGSYEVMDDLPEDIESAQFCKFDFPELHDPEPAK